MRSIAIANASALPSMQRRIREVSPRCAKRAIAGSLAPRTRPLAPCHVREVCESYLAPPNRRPGANAARSYTCAHDLISVLNSCLMHMKLMG